VELLHRFVSKNRYAALGLIVGFASLVAGIAGVMQPASVSAAQNCDKVNIVYCGLSGSDVNAYIKSFQAKYNANNDDHGHHDLQKVYGWAGASASDVKGMTASNTKIGTMYKNGEIKVGNTVVGTDAWVTDRFSNGSGFQQISDGVWARKTTTSLAESSAQVIVHFDAQGNADFAVMTGCGNAIKFTPKPQPKPALSCDALAVAPEDMTYHFQAKASASNTTITSYVFTYGDGKTDTIPTSKTTADATHTYTEHGKQYTVTVMVNSKAITGVTSAKCKYTFTTEKVNECKPGIPVGDKRCTEECKPGVPAGSPECTPCQYDTNLPSDSDQCVPPTVPPELPNTGAGDVIGLIGGVIVLAGLGHQFFLRKIKARA